MSGLLQLERCEVCQGRGQIRGVFHLMECAGCNGGGLVLPSGEALDYPKLVEQLRLRLARSGSARRHLQGVLEKAGMWPLVGPADDYRANNGRGVLGAHRAGD